MACEAGGRAVLAAAGAAGLRRLPACCWAAAWSPCCQPACVSTPNSISQQTVNVHHAEGNCADWAATVPHALLQCLEHSHMS